MFSVCQESPGSKKYEELQLENSFESLFSTSIIYAQAHNNHNLKFQLNINTKALPGILALSIIYANETVQFLKQVKTSQM
jgi:hypothetical protein